MLGEEIVAARRETASAAAQGSAARRPWSGLAARTDTAALVAAVQAFTVSRAILVTVTYFAMALHPSVWGAGTPNSASLWDVWYQWDARWYVRIARINYHWHGFHYWDSVAFFPLYPVFIFALAAVLPVSTKLIAILVSNAIFFAALIALYRLVRQEFDAAAARRTVLYISVFPTALFFFAGYSESPFLLWSVLSITAMRRQSRPWAGVFGALAAATRSQGLVLCVPFAVEWWMACGPRRYTLEELGTHQRRHLITGIRGSDIRSFLWCAFIPASWIPLACIMWARFGRPLLFLQAQQAWHRVTTWPWVGMWRTLQKISFTHMATPVSAHNLQEFLAVLFFAGLIVAGSRRLPASLSLYAATGLLAILANPAIADNYYQPLMSASRLCLGLFPCFITLGIRGSWEPLDRVVTTGGAALLAIFTVVYLQGAWVA